MGKEQYSGKRMCVLRFVLACEQALWGALAAGREKEGEVATASLEFEFHFQFPVAPR